MPRGWMMSDKQDFSAIGERIRDAIQDAMETGDFGQINGIVNDTVGGALEEVRRQVNYAHDRINRSADSSWREAEQNDAAAGNGAEETDYASRYRSRNGSYPRKTIYSSERTQRREADSRKRAQEEKAYVPAQRSVRTELPSNYFRKNGKVAGILCTVFGAIGVGTFGFLALSFLLVLILVGEAPAGGLAAVFGLLTAACAGLLGKGCGLQARLKRAERYLKLAKEKMYMEIEDLAARTGQSVRRVRKDVRAMLNAGIFPEGHMDAREKVLVLDDKTWDQYLLTQKEWESKKQLEENEQAETADEGTDLTAEQQIEKEGRAYMERLRQLNVQIPGEVISNRLYQLDYLLQRIFMVLKEHPEKCPQMRKFMDYYLPTTVKLVESYADFDKAGIQGDNIMTAKAEIEKTMDTINQAFEKLLDDMYQDAAFEAAADAKVLKTVLAQDGYMKSEFSVNDKDKEEGEQ